MDKKNRYEKRKDNYNSLVRPNGKPLNDQDKLILDLFIQFTKNQEIGTTTYQYLLDKKFPNKKSKKTVNRTLKNISLYIHAKFKNKMIIDGVTHLDNIVFCRVPDFEQKMSTLTLKPYNKADCEGRTQENVGMDKNSIGVDKSVHPHIEEGNILSSPKGEESIISEEKEKSIKKKKNAEEENTENSEARFFGEAAKSFYAFASDKDLPLRKKASIYPVDKTTVVASSAVQTSPTEPTANSLAMGLAKESSGIEPSIDDILFAESLESVSEEEHYRLSGMIPFPDGNKEIYENETESNHQEASIHELATGNVNKTESNVLPTHEKNNVLGNVAIATTYVQNQLPPNTLSNANSKDPKWQVLREQLLQSFRPELAWGIIHNLQIRSIKPNRLGLSFSRDLGLGEEQKEKLRGCLRHVYGPTIELVISRPDKDAKTEVLNCKVFVAGDATPMPKPLKDQFEMMADEVKELDTLAQVEEQEVIKPVVEANQSPLPKRKKTQEMQISIEHGLVLAETKWAQIRVAVENSFGEVLKQRFVEYFKNIEVVGMTDRLLKLKAHFWVAENMHNHQGIIEKMASRYDVDLEVENTSDGSKEYYPWTYPSHELEPLALDNVLKKVWEVIK